MSRESSKHHSSLTRGASPLGLPCTLSRAPLRRRAPFAWLTRAARSRLLTPDAKSLPEPFPPGRFRSDRQFSSHLLTDVGDVPAGQRRQLLRLAGMALDERPAIV